MEKPELGLRTDQRSEIKDQTAVGSEQNDEDYPQITQITQTGTVVTTNDAPLAGAQLCLKKSEKAALIHTGL